MINMIGTKSNLFIYLTDIPIFSSLTEAETKLLAASACRKIFPPNCIIQLEGEPASIFAVMTRGLAKAVLFREDGREILLHFYKPGDFFGEMNLSEITECPYSIMSVKESQFVFVSRKTMVDLVKRNGDFAFQFLSFVNHRLNCTQNKLRDLIYERGEGKILKYFQSLASQIGIATNSGILIPEKLSHQVVADSCGYARETVTRLLRQLQKDGVLRPTKDGWLLTHSPLTTDRWLP